MGWITDRIQQVVFTSDMLPGSILKIHSQTNSAKFMTLEVLGLFEDTDPLVVVRSGGVEDSTGTCTGLLLGSFVTVGRVEELEPGHLVQGSDLAIECTTGYTRVETLRGRMELVPPKTQPIQAV